MNGVDFPPGKRYRNRRASRADKNGICQSVLPAQMANDVICATGEGESERAVGMGPLTSISDVSDPYFVRSYHSLLPPIKARECNYTYHRSIPWRPFSPTAAAGDDENRSGVEKRLCDVNECLRGRKEGPTNCLSSLSSVAHSGGAGPSGFGVSMQLSELAQTHTNACKSSAILNVRLLLLCPLNRLPIAN